MRTPKLHQRFIRIGTFFCLFAVAIFATGFAVTQYDLTTQVKGVLPVANGGTGTANAATGTAGGVVLSTSPSITTPTLSSPTITGAMGSSIDIGSSQSYNVEFPNAGTTGTTINKLAKLTGAGTAVIAATTDTGFMVGIVVGGAGTTSNAIIANEGFASCIFDGATTQNDYVAISSSVAGDCHDIGNTYPTTGQLLGRVLSTNGAGGTFAMFMFGAEIRGSTTSSVNFAESEIPSGTINGVNATFTLANTPVTNSLKLYRNGQRLAIGAGNDFTLSTNTITVLTTAIPKTGENFIADYRF
jgi:hypothetical protein